MIRQVTGIAVVGEWFDLHCHSVFSKDDGMLGEMSLSLYLLVRGWFPLVAEIVAHTDVGKMKVNLLCKHLMIPAVDSAAARLASW